MVVRALLVAVLLVVAACTANSASTTRPDSSSVFGCVSAPSEQRHSASPFALSVSDNPVHAGDVITLHFGSTQPFSLEPQTDSDLTGYGSTWQCWDGSGWIDTHLLVHGEGGHVGEAQEGTPGVTTTVPAIGYDLPASFQTTVPEVVAGWYRIRSEIFTSEGERLSGVIAVEVVGG